MTETVQARITPAELEAIEKRAASEERSLSAIVRFAIRTYLGVGK